MGEAFNKGMSFPELSVMSFRSPMSHRAPAACQSAAVDQHVADAEPDTAADRIPEPRNERSRRPRFGDAIPNSNTSATTGAIAVSFAIVSRKNWPR
jgi:hypothetical protein